MSDLVGNPEDRFVSDLVGNPEDRFSQNEAHVSTIKYILFTYMYFYTGNNLMHVSGRIRTAFYNGISDQN